MLHRLPDSVIHSVLSYALPWPSSHHAVPLRYQLLLGYSMLSHALARVSQRLLLEYVQFDNWYRAKKLCQAIDEGTGVRRLAFTRTRTLRLLPPAKGIDRKWAIESEMVEQVVKRVPSVTELFIEHIEFDPLSLSLLVDLKTLHLYQVDLIVLDFANTTEKNPTWHLPNLTSLTLSFTSLLEPTRYYRSISILLNSLALPSLRSLAFTYTDNTSKPDVELVSPRLTHLWLRRLPYRSHTGETRMSPLPQKPLATCSPSLLHLAIDIHLSRDFEALETLGLAPPSSSSRRSTTEEEDGVFLRTLRLEGPYYTQAERLLLQKSIPSFSQLERVFLPSLAHASRTNLDLDDLPAQLHGRETNRREWESQGVQVLEKRFGHPEGTSAEVERDLRNWRALCDAADRDQKVLLIEKVEPPQASHEQPGASRVEYVVGSSTSGGRVAVGAGQGAQGVEVDEALKRAAEEAIKQTEEASLAAPV
ncbi:hypothetical protein JCM8547_006611 [Rhodosporidiobolus lusitaniae]